MEPMHTACAARIITCRGQPSAELCERLPAGTSPAAAVQRPVQLCWPAPALAAGPPAAPLLRALHGSHLEPATSQPTPQSPHISAPTGRVERASSTQLTALYKQAVEIAVTAGSSIYRQHQSMKQQQYEPSLTLKAKMPATAGNNTELQLASQAGSPSQLHVRLQPTARTH